MSKVFSAAAGKSHYPGEEAAVPKLFRHCRSRGRRSTPSGAANTVWGPFSALGNVTFLWKTPFSGGKLPKFQYQYQGECIPGELSCLGHWAFMLIMRRAAGNGYGAWIGMPEGNLPESSI